MSNSISSLSSSPEVLIYKFEQELLRAEKRITYLESCNEKGREREKALCDDVLKSHRKAAKLEQELLSAGKKVGKTESLRFQAENKRSKLQQEYFEACRKISRLEATCSSYADRESRLQKNVLSSHEKVTNFELELLSSCQKITKLESSQQALEKKKNLLEAEVLKNQEKISELEAALTTVKRRNDGANSEEMKNQFRRTELEARTKHLKSDNENLRRDLMTARKALSVLETQLTRLLKERAQLNGKLNESVVCSRRTEQENIKLHQEIEELSESLSICTQNRRSVEEYKKLYEGSQRECMNERLLLEETINNYETQLSRCKDELELMRKPAQIRAQEIEFDSKCSEIKTRETASDYDKKLAECNREIEGQRSLIGALEREKTSLERELLAVANTTQKYGICKADLEEKGIFNETLALNAVNNYKEKYESSELELGKYKSSAGAAEVEKEKAFISCQSQLGYIESEYRLKYETCRDSWQQEKSIRERLERERESADSEFLKFQSKYAVIREELGIQQELNTALLSEHENTEVKWQELVTKYKRKYQECKHELDLRRADNELKTVAVRTSHRHGRKGNKDIENTVNNANNLQIRARVYDMEEPISSPMENGTSVASENAPNDSLQYEVTISGITKRLPEPTDANGNSELTMEEELKEDDANDVQSFIDSLRTDLQELRVKNRALSLEKKKLKIEVSTLGEKHNELQTRCNELTSERDDKITGLEKVIGAKEVENEELRRRIEEEKNQCATLQLQFEQAEVDSVSPERLEELTRTIQEKESENVDMRRNINELNIERAELQDKLQQKFATEISEKSEELAHLVISLEEKETENEELKRKITDGDSEKASLQQNLQHALTRTAELKQGLKSAQEKNYELQHEIKLLQSRPIKETDIAPAAEEKETASISTEKKFFPSLYSRPDTTPDPDGLTESQRMKKELEGGVKQYVEKIQKRVVELEEHNEKIELELRQHKSEIDSSDFALRVNAEQKAKIESQDDTISELRAVNERFKIELKEKQSEIDLGNNAKDRKMKMIEIQEARIAELEAMSNKFEQQPKEREQELERENKKLKLEVEELRSKVTELEAQTRGLSRVRTDSASKRADVASIRKKLIEMDDELRKAPPRRVSIEMLYGSLAPEPQTTETDGPAPDTEQNILDDSAVVMKRNNPKIGQIPSHYRHSYTGGTYPRPFVAQPETKNPTTIPEQTTTGQDESVFHPPSERRSSFQSDTSGDSETSGAGDREGMPGFMRRPVRPFRTGPKPFGVSAPRPFYRSVDGRDSSEFGSSTLQNRRPQSWAEFNQQQQPTERNHTSSESSSVQSEHEPEKLHVEEQTLSESPVQSLHAAPAQLPESWLEFSTEVEPQTPAGHEQQTPSDSGEDSILKSPVRSCVVKDFEADRKSSASSNSSDTRDVIDESFTASEAPSKNFTLQAELFTNTDDSQPKKVAKPEAKLWSPPPRVVEEKAEKFNYKTYMKSTLITTKTTNITDNYVTHQQAQNSPQGKDYPDALSQSVNTFVEVKDEESREMEQTKTAPSTDSTDGSTEVKKRESVNSLVSQWNKRVSLQFDDI